MGLPRVTSLARLYSAHFFFRAALVRRCASSLRSLRQDSGVETTLKGKGISQDDLARAVKTTVNTVSRWETATYKPSIAYLEVLARFFGVPIAVFFPEAQAASRANALISATADLDDRDLEEVTLYARFRRAQRPKRKA